MEVILYTQIDNRQKDALLKRISQMIDPVPVMIFDFEGLFKLLKSEITDQCIIVFLISSEKELDTLIRQKSRLFNTRYIIVLTEGGDAVMTKALSLHPRYLGFLDQDFGDIGKVLNKMIQTSKKIKL